MKYSIVPVSSICSSDRTFDFYRRDLFHERDREMPETPLAAQVILRAIPETSEYQIIFGHKVIEKLPEDASVSAAIYSAAELPDVECGCVILECDRTVGAQLLTHYERACVIRSLGITAYRAEKITGFSQTQIHNWIKGADVYDEMMQSQSFDGKNLTFSHLVELANQALKYEKLGNTPLDAATKEQYLKKCSDEQFSVNQFRIWLEEKLGLTAPVNPTGGGGIEIDIPVEPVFKPEVEPTPDSENQSIIDGLLLASDLIDSVRIIHKGLDSFEITSSSISLEMLSSLAECLLKIRDAFQLRAAA